MIYQERLTLSDTHGVANVGQATWISGRRPSPGSQFVWPSGDQVVFGLPSSGLTHDYLIIMSLFNMGAKAASSTIGFFCEATATCMYMKSRVPSQNKDRLFRYGDSHVKDKTVARPSCLVHPGVRDKRRVSEIDLSQPRHETAFWCRHNGPVTSQLTDTIKWPNHPLELNGILCS